ncbi:MAG: LuxR C-terminal-related transcriptional regulator [Pseudomonadota bacterium]
MKLNSKMHELVINQVPGFICVHDLQSKIITLNDKAAKVIGFKSKAQAFGVHYTDMKCEASEDAVYFERQDQLVFSKKTKIGFVSYHKYADDWKLMFGEKSPLFDDQGDLIGLISYWTDMTNYKLIDISRFILNAEKKFSGKKNKKFTYLVEDGNVNDYKLSDRQFECLFFLLRAKTSKEIANILDISPRTVESYLNEIKLKMQCFSRAQLIDKCLHEGFLNIIPKKFLA